MKPKKTKSILACVLILCMVFGIQSNLAFVFAQENDDSIGQENITDYTTDMIDGTDTTDDTTGAIKDDTKDTDITGKDGVNTKSESEPMELNRDIASANLDNSFGTEIIPQSDNSDNVTVTIDSDSFNKYSDVINEIKFTDTDNAQQITVSKGEKVSLSVTYADNIQNKILACAAFDVDGNWAADCYARNTDFTEYYISKAKADYTIRAIGLTEYNVEGDTLTFSGFGGISACGGEIVGNQPWNQSNVSKVIISEGITSIGEQAFSKVQNWSKDTNLSLPDTLTEIKSFGFNECNLAGYIKLPKTLNNIGVFGLARIKNKVILNMTENMPAITTLYSLYTYTGNSSPVIYISNKEQVVNIGGTPSNKNTNSGYSHIFLITDGGIFPEDTVFSLDEYASPIKSGYIFDGWEEIDILYNPVNKSDNTGHTYQAKWIEKADSKISFKDDLNLNKLYDGIAVSLSENDYTIAEGAGNVTFAYRAKDGNNWNDITSAPINAGTYQVKAIVAENDTYKSTETDWKEFTISKTMPTYEVPTNLTAIVGQTLAEITLPEGFVWQDDTTTSVGSAGINTFKVAYTPKDTTNYNTITDIEVTLTVNPKMEELNVIPIINASNKTLTVGDTFDPLKDVTASDKEDGDITEKVEILSNDVDTSKAGTYTVIYKVTDSKGASSTKTITVTVKAKDTQKPTIDDNKKPSTTNTDKQMTTDNPKTGDSTNMITWAVLMFLSLGLLTGVCIVRKSRKSM
ncbi:immunoglobulin-like domain-containing protein [Extibacter muris]|uniref:immunoglobulin-like domain-containing protein n=1 Tax=Extibacter muris TaxID=1796622 RepID=UPI00142D766D|nr:immunoglobulin-like domain-containing protein [Extibacter muris]MCU0081529.1 DUF5011 domain-containing protein [Extibacter muris]MCU0081530.1 DUF5011 domain-containing protein [Extibacter muris]